jgi:hypothetical protein
MAGSVSDEAFARAAQQAGMVAFNELEAPLLFGPTAPGADDEQVRDVSQDRPPSRR